MKIEGFSDQMNERADVLAMDIYERKMIPHLQAGHEEFILSIGCEASRLALLKLVKQGMILCRPGNTKREYKIRRHE